MRLPDVGRRGLQPISAMLLLLELALSAADGDGGCGVDAEVDDESSAIKTNVAARAIS